MYTEVLLPVDLGVPASWRKALPTAIDVCRTYGGRLHVLTVVPDFGMGMVGQYFPDELEDRILKESREALIYSHGRAGVFAPTGQGATSVVGSLPMSEEQRRPVGAKARPLWGFAHKGTAAVLPGLAVEWLRRCAGRLASAPLWTETRSARIDQGFPSAALREFVEDHVPDDVAVSYRVAQGAVYKEILSCVKDIGADLVVMSSHRPEAADFLLGPNSARVVRHSPCSVWVVRGSDEIGAKA